MQEVTIWYSGKRYTIYNIYNPPANNLSSSFIQDQQFSKTILAGDFNGHSPRWGYKYMNNTGKVIEELTESTNLTVLQDKDSTPTLLHRAHNTLSRPDLTVVSSDIHHNTSFQVLEGIGSDHKPILITVTQSQRRHFEQRSKWNFKRADWDLFRLRCDKYLHDNANKQHSAEELNTIFTKSILNAAKDSIPRGCRRNYKPFWTPEIEEAVKQRREARKLLEEDPNLKNKINYNRTSAIAKRTIKIAKKNKWVTTCEALDLNKSGKKAWALLGNLSNEKRTNPKPMNTIDGNIVEDQNKANSFNKYFAAINKSCALTVQDRQDIKSLRLHEKSNGPSIALFDEIFTLRELDTAMKKLKPRKSPGPDKIHNEMLLQLSMMGKLILLKLINMTWDNKSIPATWRNAMLTPILKKNKPAEELKSYRPISLTSCVGKIAERMVNNRLYWWLESSKILTKYQAGFRSNQRTDDQLFRLTQKILDGFQDKKHTVAVFVDLQQAYDRVWRKGLFKKMLNIGIHGKLYHWIKGFLTDRTIQTKINNGLSSKQVLEEGLPQGSCLSCTLFLIFINDLPDVLDTEKAMYADDLALWYTSRHVPIAKNRLNEDLLKLNNYCEKWKLKISIPKTVYTIFTNSHSIAKKNINLTIQDETLKKEDNPAYLCSIRPTFNFEQACRKSKKQINETSATNQKTRQHVMGCRQDHTTESLPRLCKINHGVQPRFTKCGK